MVQPQRNGPIRCQPSTGEWRDLLQRQVVPRPFADRIEARTPNLPRDSEALQAGEATIHALAELTQHCSDCRSCPLAEGRQQVVVGRGNPEARLMVIGEGPGAEEDASGLPFVGRSGQLLDRLLLEAGLDGERDLYIANIVKCRPPENRKPTAREMAACRPWLDQQIALIDPALIVLAGATALAGLMGIKGGISRLRGQWLPWGERQVLPVFHPAYLLRNPSRLPGAPLDLTLGDLVVVRQRLRQLQGPAAALAGPAARASMVERLGPPPDPRRM